MPCTALPGSPCQEVWKTSDRFSQTSVQTGRSSVPVSFKYLHSSYQDRKVSSTCPGFALFSASFFGSIKPLEENARACSLLHVFCVPFVNIHFSYAYYHSASCLELGRRRVSCMRCATLARTLWPFRPPLLLHLRAFSAAAWPVTDAVLLRNLERLGLRKPTDIQLQAIPAVLAGQDVVIGAETGSGKTLAYLLPVLERVMAVDTAGLDQRLPLACLVLPTRCLLDQTLSVAKQLVQGRGLAMAVGLSGQIIPSPGQGASKVLFATPATFAEMVQVSGPAMLSQLQFFVVDEADAQISGNFKMMQSVLLDAVRARDGLAPTQGPPSERRGFEWRRWKKRVTSPPKGLHRVQKAEGSLQFIFVGATFPTKGQKSVRAWIEALLPRAVWTTLDLHAPRTDITQRFHLITDDHQRREKLLELLAQRSTQRILIFCDSIRSTYNVAKVLEEEGFPCDVLHSATRAADKQRRLAGFIGQRPGGKTILVGTDVMARGVDFRDVGTVIQYPMAGNVVDYIHRMGRTGRLGNTTQGHVESFYNPQQQALVDVIKSALETGTLEEQEEKEEAVGLERAFSRKRSFRNERRRMSKLKEAGAGEFS
eukprot:g40759.t1